MKKICALLFLLIIIIQLRAKNNLQTILDTQDSQFDQRYYDLLPPLDKQPQISFVRSRDPENLSLDESYIKMIADAFNAHNFVETGTYKAHTTIKAAKKFKQVYTVELSEELYEQAKKTCKNQPNIILYQGDSAQVLPQILKKIKGKTVIFLDAHFSLFDTAQGSQNTPILTELSVIKKAGIKDAILIIDDARMFYTPQINVKNTFVDGYPNLNDIVEKILEINPEYQCVSVYDTLIAFPAADKITVSPAVKAATISRLYQQDNYLIEHVLEAELCIAQTKDKEKQAFINLAEQWVEPWSTPPGFSSHYDLWYGLILIENQEYAKAYAYFQDAQLRGLYHWRLDWYMIMAQANCFFDKR